MVVLAKSTGASVTSTLLSQPPPTTTTPTSRRCIAVGGSSWWIEERVRVYTAEEIYGRFEGDIDRCNINKLEDMFMLVSTARTGECQNDMRAISGEVPMRWSYADRCD